MRKKIGLLCIAAIVLSTVLIAGCRSSASSAGEASPAVPALEDVVLARYTGGTITLSEFERRYAHTVGSMAEARDDSLTAYREFLDRYLDFRLKVRAARLAGYDQAPQYRADTEDYQLQTARSRLIEREVMLPILRTLHERRQEEIDVSHILVRVAEDASPADTLAAHERMQTIVDTLRHGMAFGDVAAALSDDPSAQRVGQIGYGGHLGYLTAGQAVEPFEDMMYRTPVGATSPIFRTAYGYHILRVHDRRSRPAPARVSHILIRPGRTAADSAAARSKLDGLRQQLARGADFAMLAQQHSADLSAKQGGDLGYFQPDQRIDPVFKEAAFGLDAVGDVSGIVETAFGYHLIKLTDRREPPTFDEARADLERLAAQLPRMQRAQDGFATSIQRSFDVAMDTSQLASAFGSLDLSAEAVSSMDTSRSGLPFASVGDSTYTLGNLAAFARQHPRRAQQSIRALAQAFLDQAALLYAARDLEERDKDYAFVMDEYREGLLLFQYMQDSVWTAAIRDTAALRTTYADRAGQYTLPERVRALVVRAPSDTTLLALADILRSSPPSEIAPKLTSASVAVDTVLVTSDDDGPYAPVWTVEDGAIIGPASDADGTFLIVRDAALPPRPQTFDEARRAVLKDYQEAFEARTTERLRERFDAETYPDRLRMVFTRTESNEPAVVR